MLPNLYPPAMILIRCVYSISELTGLIPVGWSLSPAILVPLYFCLFFALCGRFVVAAVVATRAVSFALGESLLIEDAQNGLRYNVLRCAIYSV